MQECSFNPRTNEGENQALLKQLLDSDGSLAVTSAPSSEAGAS